MSFCSVHTGHPQTAPPLNPPARYLVPEIGPKAFNATSNNHPTSGDFEAATINILLNMQAKSAN
jgi:hypothetical protein